jgi:hypothetical protein
LKTRVRLSFDCPEERTARMLGSVLSPDNDGAPQGLELSMSTTETGVTFRLTTDSISTAFSTVLAILRDASLFEQVWLLSRAPEGKQPGHKPE